MRVPGEEDAAKVPQERAVEVSLGVVGDEAEELDVVGALELVDRYRLRLSHRWRDFLRGQRLSMDDARSDLPLQLPLRPRG